jgi:hypothetical protein
MKVYMRHLLSRECMVCGGAVPESEGVLGLGLFYHSKGCADHIKASMKDYSRSTRGKLNPPRRTLALARKRLSANRYEVEKGN